MKTLARNKQSVWYALYKGEVPRLDADGNETGEHDIEYEEPVFCPFNCSPNGAGSSFVNGITAEPYGLTSEFTRTLITDDLNCPITDTTVLWIGADPNVGNPKYTHKVVKIARSLNNIVYVVKEVD